MSQQVPISTVYVQNLEERVGLDALTEALKLLFSDFGTVIEVVAKKNLRARGQAFIVFDRPENAENAICEMQNFEIFGKPMKLAMSRTKSDKTVELNCTNDELATHKRHRQAEKDKRKALEAADSERNAKRGVATGSESRSAKLIKPSGLKSTSATTSAIIPDEYLPPNKIIFLQNIPEEYDIEALSAIFGRFDGFREVRLVPGRKGIAFVEYDAEQGAIAAKENTAGMSLKDKVIKVTYQRQ
ncbi:hypothetical protein HIM_09147 [Hirsutella minnesotensis 3608]|uniref:RRM domain-containing protein n=1 Tax=Hirsutella minnesotensis 3608 TaxID=1043627 RepID=A0A0F7ZGT7_9HYPO|nr:hypothetical protein HIM_09147 [Hirsutella minnesotensis 3608]